MGQNKSIEVVDFSRIYFWDPSAEPYKTMA
jgi:hypothetical protein